MTIARAGAALLAVVLMSVAPAHAKHRHHKPPIKIQPLNPCATDPMRIGALLRLIPILGEIDDRAYLRRTARPGGTMTMDGPVNNISKLNPELVRRFAAAFREARADPLLCWSGRKKHRVAKPCFASIGLYSSYRAAGWGVSGFKDPSRSLHFVGLASDVYGIGRPGSPEARRWYQIAAKHLIFNPYGPYHHKEWNHYQLTMTKGIPADAPVKKTVTRVGPITLAGMWDAGAKLIRNVAYLGPAPVYRRQLRARRAPVARVRYAHAS